MITMLLMSGVACQVSSRCGAFLFDSYENHIILCNFTQVNKLC